MFDNYIVIIFFILSSILGHKLLHRVIKTPAQYERPEIRDARDARARLRA
ncbi:predicted protein [Plenodomus lingam JN3]|uniref:Predicted protein n=1 Tax=Leptosphaeria maculans (strain JN3 / isolate v23.1.3 / race Av1-4-5-6-7-8) TaxID=985895 RepID=E4ZNQ3_LEPMJ|nr:predicted protein [Plenodomus lingam JN3]CBX93272.1 predicted protein [Plenodomus lingam JN3]